MSTTRIVTRSSGFSLRFRRLTRVVKTIAQRVGEVVKTSTISSKLFTPDVP